MNQKVICIYHHVDFDGICSAKIVQEAYPNQEVVTVPWNYGDLNPTSMLQSAITKEEVCPLIIMVDVCLPIEDVKTLLSHVGYENFIWIDHHTTSIHKMNDERINLRGLQVIGGEAACVLAYKYFNKTVDDSGMAKFPLIPMGVQLIGCLDVWDKTGKYFDWDTQINPFYLGLESKCKGITKFPSIRELCSVEFVEEMIGRGKVIEDYFNRKNNFYSSKAFHVEIDGLRILALNTAQRGSSILYPIFNYDLHDGVMMFSYDGCNRIWTYSLYTTKPGIDVSTIASKRGGGGHPGASGFFTNNLISELKFII